MCAHVTPICLVNFTFILCVEKNRRNLHFHGIVFIIHWFVRTNRVRSEQYAVQNFDTTLILRPARALVCGCHIPTNVYERELLT
jgi:hypothetical protein